MAGSLNSIPARNYGNNVNFGQTPAFSTGSCNPSTLGQISNDIVEFQNGQEQHATSTKTKWIVGLGLAAAGIIYCVAKGKFLNAKQLAEHIDFKPAKTIEEAKEFAMKNLGVERYGIDKLDMANFVNEGLVNVNNRCKGKAFLPDIIEWGDRYLEKNVIMGACKYEGKNRFFMNKGYHAQLDEKISSLINHIGLKKLKDGRFCLKNRIFEPGLADTKDYLTLAKKYLSKKTLSFNEKVQLNNLISSHLEQLDIVCSNPNTYKLFLESGEEAAEIIANKNLPKTFADFLKLKPEEQIKPTAIALNESKNPRNILNRYPSVFSSPFSSIYHELGHLQRDNLLSQSYINSMLRPKSPTETIGKLTKEFLENADKQRIAGTVSNYAKSAPEEFCAEVYSMLMDNRPISDEVMNLYKSYGGPVIG